MKKSEVRIGVVGAGPWGRNLVRAFQTTTRASVTAICDSDRARLGELEAALGASVSICPLVESLLARDDVDAAVIATTAETHAPLALLALEAGRHVLVEKPMALSSTDSALLCNRACERLRTLMVGHVLLYHPALDALLSRIRNGELGEILGIEATRLSASRRPKREGAWWSLAPHDISLMRRLLDSEPTSVALRARDSTASAFDCVIGSLSFPDGSIGSIEVGLGAPSDVRRVLVRGTRRSALFDDRAIDGKLVLFDTPADSKRAADPAEPNGTAEIVPIPNDEPLALEALRFVESILDGRPVPSDGFEGHAVTSILEAGAGSLAAAGAAQSVDATRAMTSMDLQRLQHRAPALPFEAPL